MCVSFATHATVHLAVSVAVSPHGNVTVELAVVTTETKTVAAAIPSPVRAAVTGDDRVFINRSFANCRRTDRVDRGDVGTAGVDRLAVRAVAAPTIVAITVVTVSKVTVSAKSKASPMNTVSSDMAARMSAAVSEGRRRDKARSQSQDGDCGCRH